MICFKTDLAEELRTHAMAKEARESAGELDGIRYRERTEGAVRISTIDVENEAGEEKLGKKKGRYITVSYETAAGLSYGELTALADIVAGELRTLAGKVQHILVCGLGNRSLSADAVGVLATERVLVTHHIESRDEKLFRESGFFDISAICPGVMAKTGMEAVEIVRGVVTSLRPDAVIAIDALAARESTRLARTIQLSDAGIAPGSGVGNHRAAFDRETLGVPVLAVGVPTVVDTATLVSDATGEGNVNEAVLQSLSGLFVSPKEIDTIVRNLARVLGYAVNRAFHGDFSYEEMDMMA